MNDILSQRPMLVDHIQRLGPKHWSITGNKLKPWNRLLGLACHAVADLLKPMTPPGLLGLACHAVADLLKPMTPPGLLGTLLPSMASHISLKFSPLTSTEGDF